MRPKLARTLAHVHLLTTRPRTHAPTYHPPTFTHQHRRRRRPRVRFAGPHAPAGRSSGRSVGKPVDAAPPTAQVCYHVQMLYLFVPLLLGTKPKAPDAGRRRGGENGAVDHANGHANGNANGNAHRHAIKTD